MSANFRTIVGHLTVIAIATAAAACTPDGPRPSAMVQVGSFPNLFPAPGGIGDVNGDGVGDFFVRDSEKGLWISGADPENVIRSFDFSPGGSIAPESAATIGDVDGDDVPDVAYGQYDTPPLVSVLSGADGALLYHVPFLDGVPGEIRPMGDMNFDGVPDIAVANWGYDGQLGEDSGRIWRVSGADGTLSPPTDGGAGDRLGYAFDSIGDVNGDGAADLVVSATGANWGAGAAYVLDGATGIRIRSHPGGFDGFGWAVAGGADVDGDSVRDYAVGAPGFASGTGRVMVFSGATGHSIYFFTDPIARAFGLSLSFVDDADGDGVADLMVGAPDTFPQCFDYPPFCGEFLPCEEICASIGAAYLYSGATGRAIHKWIGTSEERLGWFVGGSADTNGDGMSEVLIRNLNPYSFRYGRPVAENSTKIWSYSAPGACADFDGDGYGGANGTEGCAGSGIDCDDGDPAVNPGAVEVAGNFKDDNCNGLVDEAPWCSVASGADASPWAAAPIVALFGVLAIAKTSTRRRTTSLIPPG